MLSPTGRPRGRECSQPCPQPTRTCCRVVGETRSSGVRIPRKFSGSAAETLSGGEPGACALADRAQQRRPPRAARTARRRSRPRSGRRGPRRAPRACGRPRARSRQGTGCFSRASVLRKTTPVRAQQLARDELGDAGRRGGLAAQQRSSARGRGRRALAPRRRARSASAGPPNESQVTRPWAMSSARPVLERATGRSVRRARELLGEHRRRGRAGPRRPRAAAPRGSGAGAAAAEREPARRGPRAGRGRSGVRRTGGRARAPQPAPGDLAGERQLVEPLAPVAAHARAAGRSPPRPRPATSKPASCATTSATPRGPSSRCSGSTCCQQARKRRNSAAVTGSISRRRRSSV